MEAFIEFIISLLITILLGLHVDTILIKIIPEPKQPPEIENNDWTLLSTPFKGGHPVGFFERMLAPRERNRIRR